MTTGGYVPRANADASSAQTGSRSGHFFLHVGYDGLAAGGLVLLTAFHVWRRMFPLNEYLTGDWAAFFLPMFSHLGKRLRAGDVPGWTTAQFSGVPFAADPESGWGQLLATLWFTMFAIEPAVVSYLISTLLIASLGTYALARVLGLGPLASFAAGASYGFGWMVELGACCPPYVSLASWLPVTILGIELAVQATNPLRRLGWSLGAGFGVAQLVVGFLGQGAYYALLVVVGYLAFRTLLVPNHRTSPWAERIRNLFLVGLPTGLASLGFAAISVVPAVEYVSQSNLAGANYSQTSAWEVVNPGYQFLSVLVNVLSGYSGTGLWEYVSMSCVILALLSLLVAREWSPLPYFLAIAVMAPILALRETTVLHAMLNLVLPGFEQLHSHAPARILIVAMLPTVLLAAASIDRLPRYRPRLPRDVLLVSVPGGLLILLMVLGPQAVISPPVLVTAAVVTILVAMAVAFPSPGTRLWVPIGLALTLWLDPVGRLAIAGYSVSPIGRDLISSLSVEVADAGGAVRFLAAAPPGDRRFAGFSTDALPGVDEMLEPPYDFSYFDDVQDVRSTALLLTNRATVFGLEDAQGYNPIQLRRYVEYVDAMNGHPQEYHERVIYPPGLKSPLIDLLAVRYLVMEPGDPAMADVLAAGGSIVYEDDTITIVERAPDMPRVWVVHEAQHVSADEALELLTSGAIDARQVALLESPPPLLEDSPSGQGSTAQFTVYEPDRLVIEVDATAPGLLVMSEIYDSGWTATVDGNHADVLLADFTFRAVPVSAGTHTVELVYQPRSLSLGLAVTGVTASFVLGFALFMFLESRRKREGRSVIVNSQ